MNETPKVITVTLNPSLDRTLVTNFLALGYQNLAKEARLDPAGRGVSIARALHLLGVPTHAILLVGRDPIGRAYLALLAEESFPVTVLRRDGLTRSTLIIKDIGHQQETSIWEESTGVTDEDLARVVERLRELIQPGDRVVFAGTLPGGVVPDTYASLIEVAQTAGALAYVNAGGGAALRESLRAQPRLVYANQIQLESLFNFPVRSQEEVVYCAHELQKQGAQLVLVALTQGDQAVLVGKGADWQVALPGVELGTHSGKTEAMIAGYLAGRMQDLPREAALELGAAAAAFTASQVGHEFATRKDVESLADQVSVTPLAEPPPDDETPPTPGSGS